jgi:hypothetical protein
MFLLKYFNVSEEFSPSPSRDKSGSLNHHFFLKMEAVDQYHTSEHNKLHIHCYENLKPQGIYK